MVRKKFSPADYLVQQKKKLNTGRVPGFYYDILFEEQEGQGFEEVKINATTEDVVRYLDNKQTKYLGALDTSHDCIYVVCSPLAFKLLGLKTLWAYEPLYDTYIYYFDYDYYYLEYLLKYLQTYELKVEWYYSLTFTKATMPKFCKDWVNYHVTALPKITETIAEKIIKVSQDLADNDGYYYQINTLKDVYRIPQAVCGRLAKTVLPYNTLIVIERILQIVSHSSAIIENTDLSQKYRFDFVEFMEWLFPADDETEDYIIHKADVEVCTQALDDLVERGYIDKYVIDDNNVLTFSTAFLTRHARQQIKRNIGYFDDLPAQRPYVATFINYLWWIQQAGHKQLTIALDTLLANLNLERLLREHRNGEISEILNILHKWAVKYNLIEPDEIHPEITSDDVKYLKKNRTKLHEYFKLKSLNIGGKENDSRN